MNLEYVIPESIPSYIQAKPRHDGLPVNYEFLFPEHEILDPLCTEDFNPDFSGMPPITHLPVIDLLLQYCRTDDYLQIKRLKTGEKKARRAESSVSPFSIRNHLNGKKSMAIYLMEPGSDETSIAALDFDDHDGRLNFEEVCDKVCRVQKALRKDGMEEFPVRSGGGHGAHLFLVFTTPVKAVKVRRYLKRILKGLGLKDGAGGVAKGEVEVFPKQDSLPSGGYGSPIALPYAGQSIPLDQNTLVPLELHAAKVLKITLSPEPPDQDVVDENFNTPCTIPMNYKSKIPTLEGPPLANFNLVKKGCAFILHCAEDAKTLPEPDWYYGLTIATRCIQGQEICHEISKPYPGYTFEETEKKIDHAFKDSGPVTCEKIAELTSEEYCKTCPHRGTVKSPIQLGYESNMPGFMKEMNRIHATVMIKGKFRIINEETNFHGKKEITFSSERDFRSRYANKFVEIPKEDFDKPVNVNIAKFWLEDIHRREYQGLGFFPGKKYPNYFNLFQGFAVTARSGNWPLMRTHIFDIICNRNKKIFQWVLAWMARIVQDPGGERPGTALVLRGRQGTGKGIFVKHFGAIFGVGIHYLQLTHQDQIVGRFNSHLATSILVFVDEGFWAGSKQAEGTLKAIITEDTRLCEPKGVDAFQVENHINLIMASNNDWVVPAGFEERRFLVLDVSDARQQDHQYFSAIEVEMNHGGREAMLHELLNIDISGINLRQAPRTRALLDQIEASMNSVGKFWFDCLSSGEIDRISQKDGGFGCFISTNHLHTAYSNFAKELGEKHILTAGAFIKHIKGFWPKTIRQTRSKGIGGKRPQGYDFPSLEECREAFEGRVNMKIDWSEL